MTDERLGELMIILKSAIKELHYDDAVVVGNVVGELVSEINKLNNVNIEY